MDAYQAFLKKRMGDQGGEGDLVSIVLHHHTAQIVGPIIQPIEAAPNYINMRSGGNCFRLAMLEAEKCLGVTPPNKSPVVLFMSDGGCGDSAEVGINF
jgi:hypothetical protein